ncbi:MAG: glycosyltransferase family 4 protein [Acidimicrobiales bacterium]
MARLAVVSFRLGSTDGVSVEAAKWIEAFRSLGHHVTTLAGEGEADVVMSELAIRATCAPDSVKVAEALRDAELVVVENMASLPLNVAARDLLYRLLWDRPALLHHHDLAWQRPEWAKEPPPADRPRWRHVTINDLSRRELRERGVVATTIRNTFDPDPPRGRRDATRNLLGLFDERLILLPTRAIPRKNVEGALRLAKELDAVLWLLGPAEDGFGPELERLVINSHVDVRHGLVEGSSIHDAYAASDLVVLPSTWEGFGNPVLESVTHRRALAAHPYPVLREIRAFGFRFFELDDVAGIDAFLDQPDESLMEANLAIARRHFDVADLPKRLAPLLGVWGLK